MWPRVSTQQRWWNHIYKQCNSGIFVSLLFIRFFHPQSIFPVSWANTHNIFVLWVSVSASYCSAPSVSKHSLLTWSHLGAYYSLSSKSARRSFLLCQEIEPISGSERAESADFVQNWHAELCANWGLLPIRRKGNKKGAVANLNFPNLLILIVWIRLVVVLCQCWTNQVLNAENSELVPGLRG